MPLVLGIFRSIITRLFQYLFRYLLFLLSKTIFNMLVKILKITSITIIGIITFWLIASFFLAGQASSLVFDNKVSWASIPSYYNSKQDFVRTPDGKNVEILSFDNSSDEYIIYLHGNAGRLLQFIPELGKKANVISPAYPGYHASEGSSSVENVYQTTLTTYDWLTAKGIPENKITILGHSMGGSPATYLASVKPKAKKLVLVNTFSSIQSMCFANYSIFCVFTGDVFNSAKNAEKVIIPVRQFGYEKDTTVPFVESEKLFTYFNKTSDKKFFRLTNFTHSYPDFTMILSEI